MTERTIYRRYIFIPMFMLLLFLGLFVVAEYRKYISDEEVRHLVGDTTMNHIHSLQRAIGSFESAVDLYYSERTEEQGREIYVLFERVAREESILSAHVLQEAINAEENLYQSDKLGLIRRHIERIRNILPPLNEPLLVPTWEKLREPIDDLIGETRDLAEFVERNARGEAVLLLERMDTNEKQRALLAMFTMASGLFLIVVLLSTMRRYRENADRAVAAEQYNAFFAAALHSTRVGVVIRDMQKPEVPVVFVNAAFTRMTGYTLEDTRGEALDFLFGWKTDPATIAAYRRAISLQETAAFDLLIYRKEGSPFWSEWHLSPVMDGTGRLTHFVSLFTDITAIRETQEDLIQAKKLAQHASAIKTNFLAMMSHEIRTPINGILGVLRLLQETGLDDEQKHLVTIARTSSHALHGIINDILDYVKMEAGKVEIFKEVFSLEELIVNISGLFQTVASEKGLTLEVDMQPDLPKYFVGDAGRIRQILLNLLSNGIKFTDKGFVRLRVLSLMSQDVNGRPGLLVRFEVQDTGIGINPVDQEKLFKEFSQIERSFTRRFGGTGLGLAISKRLVDLFGGEIGVESQSGKGSRFWFMIPLQIADESDMAAQGAKGKEEDEPSVSQGGHHILLVEDNDTNRLVARRYLEKIGYSIAEACDGHQAIEKVKEKDYDLILMDVSMPEMDGMLATCHIRALGGHNAQVPIIALTAHVMAGDRELCLAAGMNDYLNKPLEYEQLIKTLSRWLDHDSKSVLLPYEEVEESSPPVPPKNATLEGWNSTAALPFDPKVLERMKEDLGAEAVSEVTKVFLGDSANRMAAFEEANLEVIGDTAHTLKSCSANCGLLRFSNLMAALEKAAGEGDKARVDQLIPHVKPVYEEARGRLLSEREKYTS